MAVTYLADLLDAPSFRRAAEQLCHRTRDAHDFPRLHQLGVVVPDVERAAAELEARGIGPFFIASGRPIFWRENGQKGNPRLKLGLAYCQRTEIELLEPAEGSDFYADSLDPDGRPVVHHLGFLVDDVDAWSEKLKASGTDVYIRGQLKGIGLTADFAYMHRIEGDDLFMEFIRVKLFGVPIRLSAAKVHPIGWIQKQTGKRCLTV